MPHPPRLHGGARFAQCRTASSGWHDRQHSRSQASLFLILPVAVVGVASLLGDTAGLRGHKVPRLITRATRGMHQVSA